MIEITEPRLRNHPTCNSCQKSDKNAVEISVGLGRSQMTSLVLCPDCSKKLAQGLLGRIYRDYKDLNYAKKK